MTDVGGTIKIMRKSVCARSRRSFIFTPALKPEMFPKALACGADMVCVELEDGIAPKDKPAARENAIRLFEQSQTKIQKQKPIRL